MGICGGHVSHREGDVDLRLAYTSDIHLDASEMNRDAAGAVAAVARAKDPDVLIVAGDAGNTLEALEEALSCFADIGAIRFFVPGNHDVWIETEGQELIGSRVKYEERIPEVCRRSGFHDLGLEPVVIEDIGFVGSLGWYDYTFADRRLGLTEDDYWKGRFGDDIWWDKKMTYWMPVSQPPPSIDRPKLPGVSPQTKIVAGAPAERMRDPEVCAEMTRRLEAHIVSIENRVKKIVAVIHTLPFFVGIPRRDPPYYLDAYTGSERLGRVLHAHTKVKHCIHGHKHTNGEWTAGGIRLYRRGLGRVEDESDVRESVAGAVGVIEV